MEKTEQQGTKVMKRKSATGKRTRHDSVVGPCDREEVVALKKRIAQLEAENRRLRSEITVSADSMNRASQALSDTVREQQHNFFKYSNVRRY
jgi:hypothetical protein